MQLYFRDFSLLLRNAKLEFEMHRRSSAPRFPRGEAVAAIGGD